MQNFTFKRQLMLVVFMFLGCLAIHAADSDLITRQITIKLDQAGTLPDKIASTKKYKITNLKIIGEINGTDLRFIREMAGRDYRGYDTEGKLTILDLSEAKIVEGGDAYYSNYYKSYYTSNDVIGDCAFENCSGLTSVTIPSSVTSIGWSAFYGCDLIECNCILTTDMETYIGMDHSFWSNIPSDIKYYLNGQELTRLDIPTDVKKIGACAFYRCSGLTSVTIPSSVTSIGYEAFENCSGLTSVTIPSSVTQIGESAFSGCSGLTSVTIPSSVTSIGVSAFSGCIGLTSVTIPSSVTSLDGTFSGCSGLTSITIPSSVTSIGRNAFSGCSGLTSVTIPSSVTSIGDYAFRGCSGLTSVYVSWETPLSIAASSFEKANTESCILYVPKGTYDDYWVSNWGDYFDNIEEYDVTGINNVTTYSDVKELSRYSVSGQRLDAPTKGLNIVKYSDGSVKKVVVQ